MIIVYAQRLFMKYYLSIIKKINQLLNFENNSYELEAISSKMASKDSYLIPHIDGIFKKIKKS